MPVPWSSLPTRLTVANNEIDVWTVSLGLSEDVLKGLQATLSADEAARAARFVFEPDRKAFIAGRGILRQLLGAYLNQSPAGLTFEYGAQGKPRLAPELADLRFNMSHSHGVAVYAFSSHGEIGVDVEQIRPDFSGQDIARRYFSSDEMAELQALRREQQTRAFFLCWTRKEAYIKARGLGLQIPLDSFSVSLTPGREEVLHSADSSNWSLQCFEIGSEFVAAVIGAGKNWTLRHRDWCG